MAEQRCLFSSRTEALIFSVFVVVLPLALQCFAIASIDWIHNSDIKAGLWRACINDDEVTPTTILERHVCISLTDETLPGWLSWFNAVRVLECLGVVGLVLECGYLLFYTLCRSGNRTAIIVGIVIEALSGLCIVVGAVTFGIKVKCENDKYYGDLFGCRGLAFQCSCFAGATCLILAVSLILTTKLYRPDKFVSHHQLNNATHEQEGAVFPYVDQSAGYLQPVLKFENLPSYTPPAQNMVLMTREHDA